MLGLGLHLNLYREFDVSWQSEVLRAQDEAYKAVGQECH